MDFDVVLLLLTGLGTVALGAAALLGNDTTTDAVGAVESDAEPAHPLYAAVMAHIRRLERLILDLGGGVPARPPELRPDAWQNGTDDEE